MPIDLTEATAIIRRQLYQGQPGTGAATIYTVPASTDLKLTEVVLCNTTGSTATVTMSAVPSGGTAGATNRVFSGLALAANETVVIDLATYLTAGGFLSILQGTSGAITATISGETYA